MCKEKEYGPVLNHVMGFGVVGRGDELQAAKTPDYSIENGYAMNGIDRFNRPRSPLEIEMAMRMYYQPKLEATSLPPAQREALERFLRLGLVSKHESAHEVVYVGIHSALSVYVEKLLSIPFPEQRWFIP